MSRVFALALIAAGVFHEAEAQAQTWAQIPFQGTNFQAVACSADGTKVLVVEMVRPGTAPTNEGPLWLSTDSGTTWNTLGLDIPSTNTWGPAAMSADGSKIFVGTGGSLSGRLGSIFCSYDGGSTWTVTTSPTRHWQYMACSGNGQTVIATAPTSSAGRCYISYDAGVSWNSNGVVTAQVGCSANGMVIMGMGSSGLQISTNGGFSFTQVNIPGASHPGLCASWDGRRIIALPDDVGRIQTSSDYGMTWVGNTDQSLAFYYWYYAACSANATRVVGAGATSSSGQLKVVYSSSDSGNTWVSNNIPSVTAMGVACSADGNIMFLAARQGIWTFQTNAPPALEVSRTNTLSVLSWPISFTPTILQHTVDLSQPVWDSVEAAQTTNLSSLHISTTVSLTNNQDFFRLSSP